MRPWLRRLWATLWAGSPLVLACAGSPARPPCDEATYGALMAECTAAVATQCPPGDAPCLVEDRCDERLRARRDSCLGRIPGAGGSP